MRTQDPTDIGTNDTRLLATLQQLLALAAMNLEDTLAAASTLVAAALGAEKVDAFLLEEESRSLVAVGVSDTPLAYKQRAVGLDRLPLANGGSAIRVFTDGLPHHSGDVQSDPSELPGIREVLGIQSCIAVPLVIGEERRGVLMVTSDRPDAFDRRDLEFLAAVSRWVGVVAHRAELAEESALAAEMQGRQDAAEELLVVFSHDLRTHLWTVSLRLAGLVRRATEAGRDAEAAELGRIQDHIRRLDRLSTDLLDVERLERGLFALTPAEVDVAALVRDTAELLGAPEAPIRVEGPDSQTILADASALRQALENLLGNARAHSPPGSPVLVTLRVGHPSHVTVAVRDYGRGIASEMLPRLFQRHARGPGSQGLGLGLYLARRLVEAQGGTLDVEQTVGAGTCFCIVLPRWARPPGADDAREAAASPRAAQAQRSG